MMPFVENYSVLDKIITAILMTIWSASTIILTIHYYTKRRVITKEFAKRISLIYLSISVFVILLDALTILFWPEIRLLEREWHLFYLTLNVVSAPLYYILMKTLLLRKERQQKERVAEDKTKERSGVE